MPPVSALARQYAPHSLPTLPLNPPIAPQEKLRLEENSSTHLNTASHLLLLAFLYTCPSQEKLRLEEKQRTVRKERKEAGVEYHPRWFKQVGGGCMLGRRGGKRACRGPGARHVRGGKACAVHPSERVYPP